jgi:D-galactarolactone cycloisomerase
MRDRPAVFVRAENTDGHVGWGEIWCNFPACGAEHRVRLLETIFAPLLLNKEFQDPAEAYQTATQKTEILALQTGESGPLAQVIAGIDLALWDLCAKRANLPLFRLLGGKQSRVQVYASGINPDQPLQVVKRKHAEGYRAFKLKIGFDDKQDIDNIDSLRSWLGEVAFLMADVNQAWALDHAIDMIPRLQPFKLSWLEEPLRTDSEEAKWLQLRNLSTTPLAAGENLIGQINFERALNSNAFGVLQPDVAKWGGISGCWPVIQKIRENGTRFCPHYLGAGIGLMASAHVLAAAGGDGMLEVDANENALRSILAPSFETIENGWIQLDESAGIGVSPDIDELSTQFSSG